jgi:hypothetical protein
MLFTIPISPPPLKEKREKIHHPNIYIDYGDWYGLYYIPMLYFKYFENDCKSFLEVTKNMAEGYISKFHPMHQGNIKKDIISAIKIMHDMYTIDKEKMDLKKKS